MKPNPNFKIRLSLLNSIKRAHFPNTYIFSLNIYQSTTTSGEITMKLWVDFH